MNGMNDKNEKLIVFGSLHPDYEDVDGEMENIVCEYDVAYEIPVNGDVEFTKVGYIFLGWATSPNGEFAYGDSQWVSNLTTDPNGLVNLYAIWTPVEYTITFDTDGGNTFSPVTYDITKTVTLPTPVKSGYTFKGWKLEEAVGNWVAATYQAGEFSEKYGNKIDKFFTDSYNDKPLMDMANEVYMVKKGVIEKL